MNVIEKLKRWSSEDSIDYDYDLKRDDARKLLALVEAVGLWWRSKRPITFDAQKHAECCFVNLTGEAEYNLATALHALEKEGKK